jgi:thioredoxin 1
MMADTPVQLSDDSFDEQVLRSNTPVLVDFWAEWCNPCKMMSPILDEIAKEYQGTLVIGKLNIDDHEKTPQKYGIRGIPTFMLFKDGNLVATKVGSLTKSQLSTFIDSNL